MSISIREFSLVFLILARNERDSDLPLPLARFEGHCLLLVHGLPSLAYRFGLPNLHLPQLVRIEVL